MLAPQTTLALQAAKAFTQKDLARQASKNGHQLVEGLLWQHS